MLNYKLLKGSRRGNVSLLPSLNLKDVLYVSNLSNNLISVQKLTCDLKCSLTLFSTPDLKCTYTISKLEENNFSLFSHIIYMY